MESGVEAKPKVAPRAQSSQGPALASAQTDPQVQLHPSDQSSSSQCPPEVQGLPQPTAASQSPGDTMFQQMLTELRQSNALSRETNQLLGEIVRQQREEREVSQRQADCLLRIILEMNAFNQGTEANLPPFE